MGRISGLALVLAVIWAGVAGAQTRTFTLGVDPRLEEAGLIGFLVPRFALKYGIRPSVTAQTAGADVVILPEEAARALGQETRPAFFADGLTPPNVWSIVLIPGGENAAHGARFVDWLTGEIGQRAVASFAADGAPAFTPGAIPVEAPPPPPIEGDRDVGEKLALFHCGRCHVVNEKNRMGGIGSTPSFAALRAIPDWQSKFLAFWSANPHPSFTQVTGVTAPFDPAHPPHIAPVEITLEDVEAIAAYAQSIPPKDLGAPIESR